MTCTFIQRYSKAFKIQEQALDMCWSLNYVPQTNEGTEPVVANFLSCLPLYAQNLYRSHEGFPYTFETNTNDH